MQKFALKFRRVYYLRFEPRLLSPPRGIECIFSRLEGLAGYRLHVQLEFSPTLCGEFDTSSRVAIELLCHRALPADLLRVGVGIERTSKALINFRIHSVEVAFVGASPPRRVSRVSEILRVVGAV